MKLLCLVACAAASVANAQKPAIIDVVSAASHIPTGFPSAGIAQGSLFAIVGAGLGPDSIQVAGFPLSASLGGVSVQVNVSGAKVDVLVVLAAAKQVSAILPSNTPLGKGTVTLNNNGATATAPIIVVASAPGLFPLSNAIGLDSSVSAPALAFNVNNDGSMPLNVSNTPAVTGQTVMMVGTGMGAITSDETQSGVTDVPNGQLRVFVGGVEASNVSVARGSYPSVADPIDVSTIVNGIAALDLIQFTVPDGVSGCLMSVVAQSGAFISNPVTIAISADGGPCVNPTAADPGDTVTFNGTARVANIAMQRIVARLPSAVSTTETGIEQGQAYFLQYDATAASGVAVPVSSFSSASNLNVGTCNLQMARAILGAAQTGPNSGPSPKPPTYLDAGAALNVAGPNGKMLIKQDKSGVYIGAFATTFTIISGVPIPPTGKPFLDPGDYTVDDGAGGKDVGSFTANLTLTNPQLKFTNIDAINTIDRSKGVTVQWTGGDPNGFVTVSGTSSSLSGTTPGSISLLGSFQCSAPVSAGQFTVPAFVTSSLLASGSPQPVGGTGNIGINTYVVNRFAIPTFDLGLASFSVTITRATVYQ